MTVTGVISAVLLVAGLVIVVGSCAGMAVLDDPLDRLHLTTPAAMLGFDRNLCLGRGARRPVRIGTGRHRRSRDPDRCQSAAWPCRGPRHRDPARCHMVGSAG